jgi:cysteine desulfuration protein SufE
MNSVVRQEEIVKEFEILGGDLEMTLQYLMELGERLPAMAESEKTTENIVKGCQSKVWLSAKDEGGLIHFSGDSNTAITKGLVSLLIRVYDGQSPQVILDTDILFPSKIGMDRFIGTQRSNGFAAMIQQFRRYALVFKTIHLTKS